VSKYKADVDHSELTLPARAGNGTNLIQAVVTTVATVGVIAAGVALLEIALLPGVVIGGAAFLVPKYLLAPKYLPGMRRRLEPLLDFSPPIASKASPPGLPVVKAPLAFPVRFTMRQAIAKTITYRILVTTLDFTVNYVVIGELATAAGLSAFALVVGPLFYLAHDALWNRFGDSDKRVDFTALLPLRRAAETPSAEPRGFTISRALAKTITFRTIATTMDFTTNFVVVGDLVTAVTLSASGFILGPFVYFGHEMVWDYYGSPGARTSEPQAPAILLPAPG
jgi:uncharacterized membrane protein